MNAYVKGSKICPFDGLWCDFVASCDHVLSLAVGANLVADGVCSRFKLVKR